MKALFAATVMLAPLLAPLPAAAQTANPEQAYLAARDAAIAKLAKMDTGGEVSKQATKFEQTARTDLEKRMQAVIGKPALKGVTGTGKYNVEALMSGDIGFGGLDGLVYRSKDEKTTIVVSTESLTTKWLVDHKNWWEKEPNAPQELSAALKSEAFYTQATSAGAAVSIYAELPIAKPANAGAAAALLVVRRQDIGPSVPDEILTTSVQGGRVYIVSQPAGGKAKEIAACTAIWDKGQKESEKLFEAYQASGLKDQTLMDRHSKVQDNADAEMRKCYGERIKTEPYFAELTKTAQKLLEDLPAK